jgi:hypothetical protein
VEEEVEEVCVEEVVSVRSSTPSVEDDFVVFVFGGHMVGDGVSGLPGCECSWGVIGK